MFNNYSTDKYDPNAGFTPPPVGRHRMRIDDAEMKTSKSGNDMIEVAFSVSGHPGRIRHWFVDNEYLQQNIDPFFDAFGIRPGDFNVLSWRGKTGAAQIKHEIYQGSPQAKISYFILKSRQGDLPAWQEKGALPPPPVSRAGSLRDDIDFGAAADTPF